MEEIILNFLNDDFYSLWELKYEVSSKIKDVAFDDIVKNLVILISEGKIVCIEVSDLHQSNSRLLNIDDSVSAIRDIGNWAIPEPQQNFIQISTSPDS